MNIAHILRGLLCLAALWGGEAAHAEDFYKGKTVTLAIGASPGGI